MEAPQNKDSGFALADGLLSFLFLTWEEGGGEGGGVGYTRATRHDQLRFYKK